MAEKPRTKEWFPDNIPGLYKLSKGEVVDDIDFINSNVPFSSNERASRYKRKTKLEEDDKAQRPVGATATTPRGSPSKRARLYGKVTTERKREANLRASSQALRHELEAARADTIQHRDGIGRTRREIAFIQEERASLQAQHAQSQEEHKALLLAKEEEQAKYERELTAMMNQRLQGNKVYEGRLPELREMAGALTEKDMVIAELREQMRHAGRVTLMLEEASKQTPEDLASLPSGASPALVPPGVSPAMAQFITKASASLMAMEVKVREANTKAADGNLTAVTRGAEAEALTKLLAEKTALISELKTKEKQREGEAKAHKERLEELDTMLEQAKKDKSNATTTKAALEDKMTNLRTVLDMTEQRAVDADSSVRELWDQLHIMRSGNKVLQGAYSRLLAEHLATNPESAAKVAWTGRQTVEELKALHLSNARGLSQDLASSSTFLTLGQALALCNKQEKATLAEALSEAREADKVQQSRIAMMEEELLQLQTSMEMRSKLARKPVETGEATEEQARTEAAGGEGAKAAVGAEAAAMKAQAVEAAAVKQEEAMAGERAPEATEEGATEAVMDQGNDE